MQAILKAVLWAMPLIFGIGFLAPVISQGFEATGTQPPFGIGGLAFGLIVGGVWGGFATLKGRWI